MLRFDPCGYKAPPLPAASGIADSVPKKRMPLALAPPFSTAGNWL
jgi:hypothetical protein